MHRMAALALMTWSLIGSGSCSRGDAESPKLVVFAASSLREAFDSIGARYRTRVGTHGRIEIVYGGSQELRTQIEHGALCDVFASANKEHVDGLCRKGFCRLGAPKKFASNRPVIVAGPDSPIRSFVDLPSATRLVLGQSEVPIGAYTDRILENAAAQHGETFRAAILAKTVSREPNVRLVLSRVLMNEADGAIVYKTDARSAAANVRVIEIPAAINVVADYFVVQVESGRKANPLASSFVEFLVGAHGQALLAEHGFEGTRESEGADPR